MQTCVFDVCPFPFPEDSLPENVRVLVETPTDVIVRWQAPPLSLETEGGTTRLQRFGLLVEPLGGITVNRNVTDGEPSGVFSFSIDVRENPVVHNFTITAFFEIPNFEGQPFVFTFTPPVEGESNLWKASITTHPYTRQLFS